MEHPWSVEAYLEKPCSQRWTDVWPLEGSAPSLPPTGLLQECRNSGICTMLPLSTLSSLPARRWARATWSGVKGSRRIWWRCSSDSGAPWLRWQSSGSSSGIADWLRFSEWNRENCVRLTVAAWAAPTCNVRSEARRGRWGCLGSAPYFWW